MSDEIKNAEGSDGAAEAAPKKKKKINKLTKDELMKKIAEMDGGKLNKSTYYRHLMMRQKELQI